MRNIFSNKKFWIIGGIALILFVLLFILIGNQQQFNNIDTSSNNFSDDIFAPITLIDSPEEFSWQNNSFLIDVFEEDLDSGINQQKCLFQTCAYNTLGDEFCSTFIRRFCNNTAEISIGVDEICRFEGENACQVFVQATDLAGNIGEYSRSFNVDLTPPEVSLVSFDSDQIKVNEEYQFSVSVKDDTKVNTCGLYVDNLYKAPMLFSKCIDDCVGTAKYKFTEVRTYNVHARCSDQAGNIKNGKSIVITINTAPVIDACRVMPTQGLKNTEFNFSVNASDINNDILTYEWDFGDGTISQENNTSHRYINTGTYTPKITVQDAFGKKDQCSTSWVVVE